MSQTPHSKLNLQRMTEQRNELRALLQDGYDIIQPRMIRIATHGLVKSALRSPKRR